jgi:hypothetical protein
LVNSSVRPPIVVAHAAVNRNDLRTADQALDAHAEVGERGVLLPHAPRSRADEAPSQSPASGSPLGCLNAPDLRKEDGVMPKGQLPRSALRVAVARRRRAEAVLIVRASRAEGHTLTADRKEDIRR